MTEMQADKPAEIAKTVENSFTVYFTTEELEARRVIIEKIEAEKRDYLQRIEPLVAALGRIPGQPMFLGKPWTP